MEEEKRPYWKNVARLFGNIFFSITSVILTFVILAIIFSPFSSNSSSETERTIFGKDISRNKILAIPITGVILGDSSESGGSLSLFNSGATYGYEIKHELYDAADKNNYAGVILEINSPGGTIYGAKAITDGVNYFRDKTHKPVIAHISGLAASGAYWSAVSADAVYADEGSTTGSIGVIFGPIEFYDHPVAQDGGLLSGGIVTQNGIESTVITAGKSKDIGNPYRRLTPEEQASLQTSVDNDYNLFVSYVSERRAIDPTVIRENIGAMIYDNKVAQESKLIDATKNREEAYAELASRTKIGEGEYRVVQHEAPTSLIQGFLGAELPWQTQQNTRRSELVSKEICNTTKSILAYHGDVTALCQ